MQLFITNEPQSGNFSILNFFLNPVTFTGPCESFQAATISNLFLICFSFLLILCGHHEAQCDLSAPLVCDQKANGP